MISKIRLIPYENISGTRVKPLGLVGFDFRPSSPDIYGMAKRKREFEWQVIRLQASPAKFIGYVRAPDEEIARELAIEQYQIRRQRQRSLLIRRA